MRLGVISYLRKQLKVEEDLAKNDLALRPGERLAVDTPDGQHTLGFVTMANGRKSVYVYDWDKLADWLEAHGYSHAVKRTVDPVAWEGIKAAVLKTGALIDGCGEVCEEVTVTEADPYVMTKLDEKAGAHEVLAALFKAKKITFNPTGTKAIEAKANPRKKVTK